MWRTKMGSSINLHQIIFRSIFIFHFKPICSLLPLITIIIAVAYLKTPSQFSSQYQKKPLKYLISGALLYVLIVDQLLLLRDLLTE